MSTKVDCIKQFGGKCKPDPGCILNQAVKDSIGKVVSFNELPGYSGKRGCCNPGDDGYGGDLPFPSECIASGDSIQSMSSGCNIGYHAEYGSYSLYNNNKEVGGVDSCKKCGQYYIRDEYGICHHLEYDPTTNSCMEGDMVADRFCKSNKSSFSKFTNTATDDASRMTPLFTALFIIAVIMLVSFLTKQGGKSLFGKKR